VDAVLGAYTASRRDTPDNHLLRRAALSAEFALAQYLVKGIAAGDPGMVAEAEGMLETLASDIAEHGGQPIGVEPLPSPAVAAGTATPPAGSSAVAGSTEGASGVGPSDGGPLAGVPAVTVFPVPAEPAVSVLPVPVQPAVHVTPIPVEPQPGAGNDADAKGFDDTSTAAISIVNAKQT